jgi:hypothetical protein
VCLNPQLRLFPVNLTQGMQQVLNSLLNK